MIDRDNYALRVPIDLEGNVCTRYVHGSAGKCRDNGRVYQCTRIPLFVGSIEKSRSLVHKCEDRLILTRNKKSTAT